MATILIMDDDPQVCDLLKQVLEEEGYAVTTAENGQEGIKLYRAHPADLIILDILELRREFPQIKMIAMSGGSERAKLNLLDLANRLGAQYTVRKPFQLENFMSIVRQALA
jgi:CheY-like chemotaxis protein